MKVSVIISNYNYARYLPDAISSVLAQTYANIELVIVDDGSTDDSRTVITDYQQKAPDIIKAIFQENQGQGAAFNTAFAASTGDVIAFLDADDVWKPHKLQRIVDKFNSAANIAGVMHPLNLIDADDNVIDDLSNEWLPNGDLANIVLDTGHAWNYPPTSGLAYRRSALAKVLPMDAVKWRLCADGCLVYCTAFLGSIEGIHEVLASYRIHGSNNHADDSVSLEKQLRSLSGIEMTNRYLNDFLDNISYPVRVDLARNLQYRRSRYYLKKQWNLSEAVAISNLILSWRFYNWRERVNYLARFWAKSAGFLIGS
ncbi:MAG: glycosyltransferase [Myxacorys californica WJT36-NPBG1]|jgi:glycosyltransferase involved in cell wall biosynthesis|nr:glycosyltransferase [Myxacorys californica WJT36-NPBG1]